MSYRKLQRTSSQRKALLRDLTTDLLVNGSIKTTVTRAKEVRKTTDKMITLAKRNDLASRRAAAGFLRNVVANVSEEGDDIKVQSALQNLFEEIVPKYKDRQGGYTRILKTMPRRGDGAPIAIIELVD